MKRIVTLTVLTVCSVVGSLTAQKIGTVPAKTQTPAECRAAAASKRDACLKSAGTDKTRANACHTTFNSENHMCSGGGSR